MIEVLVVIIIVGIIASVTVNSLKSSGDTVRFEQTKKEMEQLAFAIAGNPSLISGGSRTDFGYVGDVGALPSSLDDLVQNPGGYSTWNGPYIHDDFYNSISASENEFKFDGWGTAYTYSGGLTIGSNGGGSPLTRQIAKSTTELLDNKISLTITDNNNTPPGATFADSVVVLVNIPDGSGGSLTRTLSPPADGFVQFDAIPIGIHDIKIIYNPTGDTIRSKVTISPGINYYSEIKLYLELW